MMGQKKPSLVVVSTLMIMAVSFAQKNTLYILHTNNTNGALENCYCPDHPYGAVEKRAVYVADFIQKNPNTILLDAGDIFTMTHQPLKDSLMAVAYGQLPYDAILFGDQEMTLPPDRRAQLISMMDIPVVGTNIEGISTKVQILEKNGVKIAILGIMDPHAIKYYPESIRDQIELTNPAEAIQNEMNGLKDEVDVIILLTHQGADLDYDLAESIDGIDVIIGSHSQSNLESPETVNGTLITQAGKEGYYIGVIELTLKKGKVVDQTGRTDTMKFEMPDNPAIMQLIEEYEQKSGRVNHQKLRMRGKKH